MRDSLTDLKIARNCPASWSLMQGDDFVRHCSQCDRKVYDLSNLTRQEASNLIESQEGRVCIRYYRRGDGMVMTKDCGKARLAWRKVATVLASNFALLAFMMPSFAQGQVKTPRMLIHSDEFRVKMAKGDLAKAVTEEDRNTARAMTEEAETRVRSDRQKFGIR